MIRRNAPLGDQPSHWLLVDQIAHARVSHQLAELWQADFGLLVGSHRAEVLAAIAHHDDGWRQWDSKPEVSDGTPVSFFAMQQEESIAIWQLSIERASECGPLAAYSVAGHFLHLLEESDRQPSREVEQWVFNMRAQQRQWANRINDATSKELEQAFRYVRIFDWISLWLCCYAKQDDQDLTSMASIAIDEPSCPELQLSLESTEPGVVEVSPWRFTGEPIDVELPAQVVPQQHYDSTDSLLASSASVSLTWRFLPVEN